MNKNSEKRAIRKLCRLVTNEGEADGGIQRCAVGQGAGRVGLESGKTVKL